MAKVIGVTGHKPDKLGGYKSNPVHEKVIYDLTLKIRELAPDYLITGMEQGVGQWAGQIAATLGIPFVAAIPHRGFSDRWPELARIKFDALLRKAHSVVYVSEKEYFPGAFNLRNRWMIDSIQELIAVFDGSEGNTANCVTHAEIKVMPVHRILPQQYATIAQAVVTGRDARISGAHAVIQTRPSVVSTPTKPKDQEEKIFNRMVEID